MGLLCEPVRTDAKRPLVTRPFIRSLRSTDSAWDCTRAGGHVMLMGFTLQPVSFPGTSLALLGRTIHPGQQGGLHVMRDIPRYVKLIEKGTIDATSIISKKYTLDQGRQAVIDTGERTIITGVIEFN